MLEINQIAPVFKAKNQDNEEVTLDSFKGKQSVVLYFYPKDDTPGCTIEANDFTKLANKFAALKVAVIGVSKDSCASHQAFINKYDLKLDLLADEDGVICEAYNVWREKEKNGIKKMAILRSTFIINPEGKIAQAMYGINHEGHAQAVLESLKG